MGMGTTDSDLTKRDSSVDITAAKARAKKKPPPVGALSVLSSGAAPSNGKIVGDLLGGMPGSPTGRGAGHITGSQSGTNFKDRLGTSYGGGQYKAGGALGGIK